MLTPNRHVPLRKSRHRRFASVLLATLAALTLLVIAFYPLLLQSAGNYLLAPSSPEPSDVIIVLGGERKGERTKEGVRLLKAGMAEKILLSDGTDLSWRLRTIEEMKALALALGVPAEDILLENRSRSTYENAAFTRELLSRRGVSSAIVVTSEWHLRRTQYIFDKVYSGSGISLTYAGAQDPRFPSLDEWWKDHEKQQVVLTEWGSLILYWMKYR